MNWIRVTLIQIALVIIFFLIVDFIYTKFSIIKKNFVEDFRAPHEVYHHTLKPSFDGIAIWGNTNYRICTDANGFKSDCKHVERKKKKYDIAFIGDSFTEGTGYPFEDTFVGMFSDAHPNLSIANLAVESYSPTVYFKKIDFLLKQGFFFDHIYVFIDISDIQDESIYSLDPEGNVLMNNKLVNYEKPNIINKLKQNMSTSFKLSYQSYLIIKDFFIPQPTNKLLTQERAAWTYNTNLQSYGELGVKGSTEKAVNKMNLLYELLKVNKIKLSIGVYPWPTQLLEMKKNLNTENSQSIIWRDFCEKKCENFVDFFPVYKELLLDFDVSKIYKKYYLYGDIHFNYEGHKFVFNHLLKIHKR
jgi:hypothetical protein